MPGQVRYVAAQALENVPERLESLHVKDCRIPLRKSCSTLSKPGNFSVNRLNYPLTDLDAWTRHAARYFSERYSRGPKLIGAAYLIYL